MLCWLRDARLILWKFLQVFLDAPNSDMRIRIRRVSCDVGHQSSCHDVSGGHAVSTGASMARTWFGCLSPRAGECAPWARGVKGVLAASGRLRVCFVCGPLQELVRFLRAHLTPLSPCPGDIQRRGWRAVLLCGGA